MKKGIYILLSGFALFIFACGGSQEKSAVAEKKQQLETLKKQQTEIAAKITALEAELIQLDPSLAKQEIAKLVQTSILTPENFTHFIELQGKIDAENISYVTPRQGGGQVKALYIKKGDYVKKGQLLLQLDENVLGKQIEQVQTQLNFAKEVYQRQQNLWKQNIGTEVQLLQAKNNVETLEKQIATLKEQMNLYKVYAEVDGIVDEVNVRVGEFFTGATAMGPQIRIVNTSSLKALVQVPELYLDRVQVGTPVKIELPDIQKTIDSKVSLTGKIIDPSSRSFYVEAKVPNSKDIKPNQLATIKILDYSASNAITIPVNTLQNDQTGKFVMVAVQENQKWIAKKRNVVVGELYGDKLEVKQGLKAGDVLITEGFQGVYEGQLITTGIN